MSTPAAAPVTVQAVVQEADLMQALAIREVVFIEEQQVPPGIERDDADAGAFHVLAFEGKHAVGTGRLVLIPTAPSGETGKWGRIGRMAVLKACRKHGIGSRVLLALESEARRRGIVGILLHAQTYAVDFYRRHGYRTMGEIFDEAGLPHLEMRKGL